MGPAKDFAVLIMTKQSDTFDAYDATAAALIAHSSQARFNQPN
jgi:hypothetical protein